MTIKAANIENGTENLLHRRKEVMAIGAIINVGELVMVLT